MDRGTNEAAKDAGKVLEENVALVVNVVNEELTNDFVMTQIQVEMNFAAPMLHRQRHVLVTRTKTNAPTNMSGK